MTEEVKFEQTIDQTQQEVQQKVETPVQNTEATPEIKSESNQSNWKQFREEREKERAARVAAEKEAEKRRQESEALKAAMEALIQKDTPPQQGYYQDTEQDEIDKKIAAALEKQKQKYEEERRQHELQDLPRKLQQTYKDFDKVCTDESMDYLAYHHPEIVAGYKYMPDGFEKWATIYQTIKKFVPVGMKEDAKRIQENAMKPKSVVPNLTDPKPVSAPWILDEARKKANWERMQREQRNIS